MSSQNLPSPSQVSGNLPGDRMLRRKSMLGMRVDRGPLAWPPEVVEEVSGQKPLGLW